MRYINPRLTLTMMWSVVVGLIRGGFVLSVATFVIAYAQNRKLLSRVL